MPRRSDHPYQVGQVVAVGNVYRGGPNTPDKTPFFQLGGYGDVQYYGRDNIAVDKFGQPEPMFGRYTASTAKMIIMKTPPLWPAGLKPMPADQVQNRCWPMSAPGPGTATAWTSC